MSSPKTSLKNSLDQLSSSPNKKVLVIGDLILDEYIEGEAHRISPESPTPVVLLKRKRCTLGGAANAARTVRAMEMPVVMLGVVGDDEHATEINTIADSSGIDYTPIVEADRPTTVKSRIIANSQQIARVDHEVSDPITEATQKSILDKVVATIANVDVVVLSDYGKGGIPGALIGEIIALCEKHGVPSIVDPKGFDYRKYKGASVITPNLSECYAAVGQSHDRSDWPIEKVIELLRQDLPNTNIVLTRGSEGMSVYSSDHNFDIPTLAQQVFDVTGAGDTVVGTLAVAMACSCSFPDAVSLANAAAGLVVSKPGTAVVTQAELMKSIAGLVEHQDSLFTK